MTNTNSETKQTINGKENITRLMVSDDEVYDETCLPIATIGNTDCLRFKQKH